MIRKIRRFFQHHFLTHLNFIGILYFDVFRGDSIHAFINIHIVESCLFIGSSDDWKVLESSSESKSAEVRTTSSKKGKALFQRCAERQDEEEITSMVNTSQVLPGVDLEEIEDEFEKLHREMMGDSD